MGKPVYKMFKMRLNEAWYQLDAAERDELTQKVDAALEAVGGKRVVVCNAHWASDSWLGFGVEEFPDIDAVQKHAQLLEEINWHRYGHAETLLGTSWGD